MEGRGSGGGGEGRVKGGGERWGCIEREGTGGAREHGIWEGTAGGGSEGGCFEGKGLGD